MIRKLISLGILAVTLTLVLALMPACGGGGGEEGEVKTLKIGLIAPLSGPAAAWGTSHELGVKWKAEEINAAGGIKVGADRYMIEVESCDDKYTGSVAADCAQRLVSEGIKFVIGPIGTVPAVLPILNQAKVLQVSLSDVPPSTEWPYHFNGNMVPSSWLDTWYKMVSKHRPELKTVVVINPETESGHSWMDSSLVAAPKYGMTVVDQKFYDLSAVDFYPMLTSIVAKNPDAVEFGAGPGGTQALQVKQLRELGYKGFILQACLCPIEVLKETAGPQNCWGIATDQADYTNPVFPQSLRDMYQEWLDKYAKPGETTMNVCIPHGYGHMEFIKAAIEKAGSIDVDKVIKAAEDPGFTFERYLNSPAKLGGLQTFGIKRMFPHFIIYAEIQNAQVQIIDSSNVITP